MLQLADNPDNRRVLPRNGKNGSRMRVVNLLVTRVPDEQHQFVAAGQHGDGAQSDGCNCYRSDQ
jgi:hypothetical protein